MIIKYSTRGYSPKNIWFLRGIEEAGELDTRILLNNESVYMPIESIFLPSEIRHITYVSKSKTIYFTTYDRPDLIRAQLVCDVNSKQPSKKEQVLRCQNIFENRAFITMKMSSFFKIISLLATKRFLYVLAIKEGINDKLYLFKTDVDKDRAFQYDSFNFYYTINIEVSPEIKLEIADNGENQFIFLSGCSNGKIYYGLLNEKYHLEFPEIKLQVLEKLVNFLGTSDVIMHFQGVIKGEYEYLNFLLLDKKNNRVHEYYHPTSKVRDSKIIADLINTKELGLDISAISSMNMKMSNFKAFFKTKLDKVFFQFITSKSPNTIWTLTRHQELGVKLLPLIGGNRKNTPQSYNMLNYYVPNTDTICIIEDKMIVLGKRDTDDWHVILIPQNDWLENYKINQDNSPKSNNLNNDIYLS